MDHDALFKMLLKTPTVLQAFFEAFLPEAAKFVDFGALEFVDKELFTMDQKKRTGDLLVRTRFRGAPAGFLIHLEHQAQADAGLARRLLEYFIIDWREYNLPVYPVAVLSYRLSGTERLTPLEVDFPNKSVLRFDFDAIDLAPMDGNAYLRMRNPAALALSARMDLSSGERVLQTRDFFIGLSQTAGDLRVKDSVAGFFSAYQPLSAREALQLAAELGKLMPGPEREQVMNLTNPFIELGKERGRQEGETEMVLRLLSRRLGTVSAIEEQEIRGLALGKIEELGEALLDFSSRDDLGRWLRANK
jgi:hypothetical protein